MSYLSLQQLALFMSYSGLLLDLFGGFMLLHPIAKYLIVIPLLSFHYLNTFLFNIKEFGLIMMASCVLFFDWSFPSTHLNTSTSKSFGLKKIITTLFVAIYLCVQILVPLRPYLAYEPGHHPCLGNEGQVQQLL
jgi:hypothetical protein